MVDTSKGYVTAADIDKAKRDPDVIELIVVPGYLTGSGNPEVWIGQIAQIEANHS